VIIWFPRTQQSSKLWGCPPILGDFARNPNYYVPLPSELNIICGFSDIIITKGCMILRVVYWWSDKATHNYLYYWISTGIYIIESQQGSLILPWLLTKLCKVISVRQISFIKLTMVITKFKKLRLVSTGPIYYGKALEGSGGWELLLGMPETCRELKRSF